MLWLNKLKRCTSTLLVGAICFAQANAKISIRTWILFEVEMFEVHGNGRNYVMLRLNLLIEVSNYLDNSVCVKEVLLREHNPEGVSEIG